MNIQDLIFILKDLADFYPEAEVRMANQPNWPFEYSIEDVVAVEMENEEDEEELGEVIIYLGEGRQIGYLPEQAKDELGW
jgi:hypothetical protein